VPDAQITAEKLFGVLHNFGWEEGDYSALKPLVLRKAGKAQHFLMATLHPMQTPLVAIAIATQGALGRYQDFYQKYLDMDFGLRLLLDHVQQEVFAPYVLCVDGQRAYLYDVDREECLVYCEDAREQAERLFPHFDRKKMQRETLEQLPRRTDDLLGRELCEWVKLWSAELGSKTGESRDAMARFFEKLLLLRYFSQLFGRRIPLSEFRRFLDAPERLAKRKRLPDAQRFLTTFLDTLATKHHVQFCQLGSEEKRFLRRSAGLDRKLNEMLLQFNLLSREKFTVEVFVQAYADLSSKLKSWKARYTTRDIRLKDYMVQEEVLVYKPLTIALDDVGYAWMLRLFEEVVEYWMDYNRRVEAMIERGEPQSLQLDFFHPLPKTLTASGAIQNVVAFTLETSFRVQAQHTWQKDICRFLLSAKVLEICRRYKMPLTPLVTLDQIFQS
jgi:hypothetical protein